MRMKKWRRWRSTMDKIDINENLLREMYNKVRSAEIKNIKTQKNDDKQMVSAIEKYIVKKVEEEVHKNED